MSLNIPALDSGDSPERRARHLAEAVAALPVPPPSVAVGETLGVPQIGANDPTWVNLYPDLDEDGRTLDDELADLREMQGRDAGPGDAETVESADDACRDYLEKIRYEQRDRRSRDSNRQAGRILELEDSLKALAMRSVEWHDERLGLLRTIDDLRAKRPRTVIGVAAQAGRGLLDVWGGR